MCEELCSSPLPACEGGELELRDTLGVNDPGEVRDVGGAFGPDGDAVLRLFNSLDRAAVSVEFSARFP